MRDVVIVKDKVKRCFWKLAVAEQLNGGKDGHVRAVVIKVGESNSSRKKVTLKRNIKQLYPIEVKADDTESESDEMLGNPARSKEVLLETATMRNPQALEKTGGTDVKQPFEVN